MAKAKKVNTLSISINQNIELALKGTIDKSFKLNNNRKKVYIYENDSLKKLFEINVKPSKDGDNIFKIELEEIVEGTIVSFNKMNSKFGDIYILGLSSNLPEIKTSTVILNKGI